MSADPEVAFILHVFFLNILCIFYGLGRQLNGFRGTRRKARSVSVIQKTKWKIKRFSPSAGFTFTFAGQTL